MARRVELVEVGDFVTYKDHLMAVIAFHEDQDKVYALCQENHKVVKFERSNPDVKIVKKKGCKAIVAAIYSDMEYML